MQKNMSHDAPVRRNRVFSKKKFVRNMSWLAIFVGIVMFLLWPLGSLAFDGLQAKADLSQLKAGKRAHNFSLISTAISRLTGPMRGIKNNVARLSYLQWIPGISGYWKDANALSQAGYYGMQGLGIMMPQLSKVAPLFGYSTATTPHAKPVSGKAKIYGFVHALPEIGPALMQAKTPLTKANSYFQQVNPQLLSSQLAKYGVSIGSLQQISQGLVANIPTIDHSVSVLQSVLGVPHAKRYLLVFQNSGELRPTGGFMTSYGYVTLNNGKLGKLTAHNIYSLASVVTYRPSAPPILGYVYTQHWHIRDANLSPNVPTTVNYIQRFYNSIPNAPHINGVIFIDTWFVDKLLQAVGPITMPATYHHIKITAQNANYEMEYLAERAGYPAATRKKFIGIMMHMLIHKVMSSHGSQLTKVIGAVGSSLTHKLVVVNFHNPQAQALAVKYNWAGTFDRNVRGDYLEVVDANLGGHKDNYFMHYYVSSNIRKIGTRYQQSTTITWVNPAVLDHNWLVVPYKSWTRLYVPYGSRLISITGNVNGLKEQYNNNLVHKTVFGDHVSIAGRKSLKQPPAKGHMTVTYWLPKGIHLSQYVMQKQPGVRGLHETVNFGSFKKTFYLNQDTRFSLKG